MYGSMSVTLDITYMYQIFILCNVTYTYILHYFNIEYNITYTYIIYIFKQVCNMYVTPQ